MSLTPHEAPDCLDQTEKLQMFLNLAHQQQLVARQSLLLMQLVEASTLLLNATSHEDHSIESANVKYVIRAIEARNRGDRDTWLMPFIPPPMTGGFVYLADSEDKDTAP